MSTRKAKDDSVFHQNRYASAPEFVRGLLANLVAKRCAILDGAPDRELIWFIQYLSRQEGGLAAVVKDILAKFPDHIQSTKMAAMNLKRGKVCDAATVKKVRTFSNCYPVKGEHPDMFWGDSAACLLDHEDTPLEQERKRLEASKYPATYQSDCFFDDCQSAAQDGLEKHLCELCLDPKSSLTDGPWYFPRLIEALREYQTDFARRKGAGVVVTALGEKVHDVLDYTFYSRGMTLMQGDARTGKTFAARSWCEQRPGVARFVEVPPGNDEAGFFRALARGLGIGDSLNYKLAELRERVEAVLFTKNLLLVLDEGQRLWPQINLRYGFPARIIWVMTMANAGIPIAMVATPQFIETQKAVEKRGWNAAQLTGRISHFETLPADLSADDLMAVAKSVLPEASDESLRALAVYARTSSRYLAAIDSIATRARYIAMLDKRATATTGDVRRAMQESVIPSDTKLNCALEKVGRERQRKLAPASAPQNAPDPEDTEEILPAPSRLAAPVGTQHQRAIKPDSLIEA